MRIMIYYHIIKLKFKIHVSTSSTAERRGYHPFRTIFRHTETLNSTINDCRLKMARNGNPTFSCRLRSCMWDPPFCGWFNAATFYSFLPPRPEEHIGKLIASALTHKENNFALQTAIKSEPAQIRERTWEPTISYHCKALFILYQMNSVGLMVI